MVGWPHRLDGHEFEQALGHREASERTGKPGMLQSMGSQRVGHDLATEQQFCKLQKEKTLRLREIYLFASAHKSRE